MAVIFDRPQRSLTETRRFTRGGFQQKKTNTEEIVAVFHRQRQKWDDVKIVDMEDGTTIKVTDAEDALKVGETYRFMGRWSTHPKYGKQFIADSFATDSPINYRGVIVFLSSECDHIGKATAEKIWAKFGSKSIDIVRDTPHLLVEAGILGETEANEASECIKFKTDAQRTKIELMGMFKGRGFGQKCLEACMSLWGAQAANIVRRDPFKMMVSKMPGASFLRCDRLYTELALPPRRLKRQMLKAWYELNRDSSGHTWFPMAKVQDVDPKAIELGIRCGWLVTTQDIMGRKWITERTKAESEECIVSNLKRLCSWKPSYGDQGATRWPGVEMLEGISEHQRDKVGLALQGPVAVISGSPGTGKTYTAAAVIKAIMKHSGGTARIHVCAPTGKAAVRVQESLQKATGIFLQAKTIHSLCGINVGEGEDRIKRDDVIDGYLICDETSMVTTDLMARLLAYTRTGTHILFLGDPYQLPPVGHGAPLRDLIRNDAVSVGELTEIQRNAGRIVKACSSIKDGERFEVSAKYDKDSGENLRFIETPDSENSVATVLKLVDIISQPQYGFDPVWDTQILCAVNTKGKCSRVTLNAQLQQKLNPKGHTIPGHPFRVNDKIICLKNSKNMKKVAFNKHGNPLNASDYIDTQDPSKEAFVANGEIGRVLAVGKNQTIARFDSPARTIRILHGSQEQKENEKKALAASLLGDDDQGDQEETDAATSNFDLGYAITTHKSQGSEAKCIIVVIDPLGRSICTREHVYTSISRAKDLCLMVGQRRVCDSFVSRVALNRRKTFLVEMLNDAFGITGKGKIGMTPSNPADGKITETQATHAVNSAFNQGVEQGAGADLANVNEI